MPLLVKLLALLTICLKQRVGEQACPPNFIFHLKFLYTLHFSYLTIFLFFLLIKKTETHAQPLRPDATLAGPRPLL